MIKIYFVAYVPSLKKVASVVLFQLLPIIGFCQNDLIVLISEGSSTEPLFSYWSSSSSIEKTQRPLREKAILQKQNFSNYTFIVPSTEPLLFNFSWNFKIQLLWLFPGDTLFFTQTLNDTVPYQFRGTRPYNELMFYSILETSGLGLMAGNYDLEITKSFDFKRIGEQTFKRYEARLKTLNDMMGSGEFSKKGFQIIKKSLYYQYLSEMLFPYQVWTPIEETIKANSLVPNGYKTELKKFISEIDKDTLIYLLDYKRFALQYARFLVIESAKQEIHDLPSLLSVYQNKFVGKLRDCLLFDEIYLNYLNTGNVSQFSKVFDSIENDSLRNVLVSLHNKSKINFSHSALQTELFRPSGEKIMLKEIFANDTNKLTYIDFWATWCAPCLMEMPNSKKLAEEFKNDSIMFVYISIDRDREKWLKRISTLPQGKNIGHYYLGDDTNFSKEMEIISVPRYFLIGRNGRMISSKAPRPASKEIRELISDNLK